MNLKRTFSVLMALLMLVVCLPFNTLEAEAASTLIWPVPGHFALSRGYSSSHGAMDINDSSIRGATIVAALGGTITRISKCTSQHYGDSHTCGGTGTGVVIKGTDGRFYSYAHMTAGSIPSDFKVGTTVSAGQTIGKVGTTGNSSGPHLHFSVSNGKTYLDQRTDPELETYKYTSGTPFSFTKDSTKTSVTNTDAVIAVRVSKPANNKVIKYGATVYLNNVAIGSVSASSSGQKGVSNPQFYWTVSSSMGITLTPGTTYQFTFWTNISGVTLTSPKYSFTTTGTAPSYQLTYNANGGSGAPASQTKTYGQTLTLSSVKPTRSGYTFLGWATSASATSATYSAGGSFTSNANTTLYAVWSKNVYTVSYNANGGSGAPATQQTDAEGMFTIPSTIPVRSDYNFLGWATSATATTAKYYDGKSYATDKNVTFYAVWEKKPDPVKITKQPVSKVVKSGEKVTISFTAVGDGLTYEWYHSDRDEDIFWLTTTFTTNEYTTKMNGTRAGRKIYCVVTDKYGNTAKTDIVTIGMAVSITQQPTTVSVQSGKQAKVTVSASGEGKTYKWYYKDKSATKFTLTNSFKGDSYYVEMNGTRAGRQVYCVITDKYGNSVKTDVVTLGMAVKITKQPTSVTVANGSQAKVTVSASGEGKTYKWYFKDKGATKFSLTNSFKGDSYYVTMTDARAGRQIYCVITDKYGNSEKTNVVTLNKK